VCFAAFARRSLRGVGHCSFDYHRFFIDGMQQYTGLLQSLQTDFYAPLCIVASHIALSIFTAFH
jgi:hypothetical protein